jgi:cysteine-rich repeat protein
MMVLEKSGRRQVARRPAFQRPFVRKTIFLCLWISVGVGIGSGCGDDDGSPDTVCGDGICQGGETAEACFADCGCGNGIINPGEQCDGAQMGAESCESLGYAGGTLTCTNSCVFNMLTCDGSVCGDGVISEDEQCDGEDLNGQTCVSLGFDSGSLSCADDCQFDTTQCVGDSCGDGVKDAGEQCDGQDLGEMDCDGLGYAGGRLRCRPDCTYDTTECTLELDCGNGVVDADEQCDDGGESATCDRDCTFVECGDGVVNISAGEDCDDSGSSPHCDADCTVVECGDGMLNTDAGEVCDPGGETMECDADCTLAECGDGWVNTAAAEQCDDGGNDDCDGCSASCTLEECGNGVVDCGEQCDGGGQTVDCDFDCTPAECGDGVKNIAAGEQCDDGGNSDGDGCSASCNWEQGAAVEVLLIPDSVDDRVSMFDPGDGTLLGDFIAPNTAADPYQLSIPVNAVQGPNDHIYVSDQGEDKIFEFAQDGTFIGVFASETQGIDNIRGIHFAGGDLYVSVGGSQLVARFDLNGNRLSDYVNDSSNPFDILFLDSGEMLMSNIKQPEAVRLYAPGGQSFSDLHSVVFPEQLNLTSSGTILVASFSESTVTELELGGTVMQTVSVGNARGCHALQNGHWLVTGSATGVEEINPAQNGTVEIEAAGAGWRFIERVVVASSVIP